MTAALSVLDTAEDSIADLPFPLTSFPTDVAAWLEATAAHVRVPVAFVAFPFLALTGAVLGNQISLQLNPRWVEHAALWVALVAPSGHGKTPALAAARAPFTAFHKGGGPLLLVTIVLLVLAILFSILALAREYRLILVTSAREVQAFASSNEHEVLVLRDEIEAAIARQARPFPHQPGGGPYRTVEGTLFRFRIT